MDLTLKELQRQNKILNEFKSEIERIGREQDEAAVAKIIHPNDSECEKAFEETSAALRRTIELSHAYQERLSLPYLQ